MAPEFKPGTPNWVDLGTSDVDGALDFYGQLFGWTADDAEPDTGGYRLMRKNGKQVGAIAPTMDPSQPVAWSSYFATEDAADVAAKVEANGGKVIVAPMEVMEQGTMAVFADPAGAVFSVWQPGQHRGAELVGEPGSFAWTELMTTDIAATKSFYPAVLPVTTQDLNLDPTRTYTLLNVDDKGVAGAMAIAPDMGEVPTYWAVYFEVDNCDRAADKAIELGATQIMRQDSPAGRFAVLSDPQGAVFSIIQSDPNFSM